MSAVTPMTHPAGAAAPPDVAELLAPAVDDAERLAAAGQVLADVAQHIGSARALLREVADTDAAHAVADLLALAGWLADFGARLAGEPGQAGDPLHWLMKPTTRAAVERAGGAA
ncbi:MAG: hypothetical protein RL456_615 [Pseudomonadota bacterium]